MSEERADVQKMSVVGHRIWLHMQDKGPYNKRAFARFLKRKDVLSTTHQSISGWLRKDHPPVYFVNAVVEGLELGEVEKQELWRLYFEGKGPIPQDPALTEENREYIAGKKEKYKADAERERRERGNGESSLGYPREPENRTG